MSGLAGWIENLRHVVRFGQSHVRPRAAGVDRFVDAVAGVRAARLVGLARAHPDDVRGRRRNRHGANRRDILMVEDRLEGRAVVGRLPHAAVPGRDVERVEVLVRRRLGHRDIGQPRPGAERPQVAEFEPVEQRCIEAPRRRLGCEAVAIRQGEQQRCHDHARSTMHSKPPFPLQPRAASRQPRRRLCFSPVRFTAVKPMRRMPS